MISAQNIASFQNRMQVNIWMLSTLLHAQWSKGVFICFLMCVIPMQPECFHPCTRGSSSFHLDEKCFHGEQNVWANTRHYAAITMIDATSSTVPEWEGCTQHRVAFEVP